MKIWKKLKLAKWWLVDTSHKTPRHIQQQYIDAAIAKRKRRAEKWNKIAGQNET